MYSEADIDAPAKLECKVIVVSSGGRDAKHFSCTAGGKPLFGDGELFDSVTINPGAVQPTRGRHRGITSRVAPRVTISFPLADGTRCVARHSTGRGDELACWPRK